MKVNKKWEEKKEYKQKSDGQQYRNSTKKKWNVKTSKKHIKKEKQNQTSKIRLSIKKGGGDQLERNKREKEEKDRNKQKKKTDRHTDRSTAGTLRSDLVIFLKAKKETSRTWPRPLQAALRHRYRLCVSSLFSQPHYTVSTRWPRRIPGSGRQPLPSPLTSTNLNPETSDISFLYLSFSLNQGATKQVFPPRQ